MGGARERLGVGGSVCLGDSSYHGLSTLFLRGFSLFLLFSGEWTNAWAVYGWVQRGGGVCFLPFGHVRIIWMLLGQYG